MRRILIFSTLIIVVAGSGLYVAVRSLSPAPATVQPSAASVVEPTEAFDVSVDEITAQETLDLAAADGAEIEEGPDDDTLDPEEDTLTSLDADAAVNQ